MNGPQSNLPTESEYAQNVSPPIGTNRKEYLKNWNHLNRERKRIWGLAHKEQKKIWYDKNKELIKERQHNWYLANKERIRERKKETMKIWRIKSRERINTMRKAWRKANPEKEKNQKKRDYVKYMSVPKGKLHACVSTNVRSGLKRVGSGKRGMGWETIVGYNVDTLRKHLEKQFDGNMSWENYGGYWHVDHKIPVSAFNFTSFDDIDFKRCWSLKNLQPMERIKNISKGAKLCKPFQPALTI